MFYANQWSQQLLPQKPHLPRLVAKLSTLAKTPNLILVENSLRESRGVTHHDRSRGSSEVICSLRFPSHLALPLHHIFTGVCTQGSMPEMLQYLKGMILFVYIPKQEAAHLWDPSSSVPSLLRNTALSTATQPCLSRPWAL